MSTVDLEDVELQDAAQAARVAAALAEKDAEKQGASTMRVVFDRQARRFWELANKFERARVGRRA